MRLAFAPFLGGLILATIGGSAVAAEKGAPHVRRLDGLIVMTPSPTQAPPPGLRLRTMVRPADRLWIGVDVPSHVSLEVGDLKLDLLDPKPGGGWVATYRETFERCYARGDSANCKVVVKIFDGSHKEVTAVALDAHFSRRDRLEVQDVRYVEDSGVPTLYFNEACQSYSKQAGRTCSALVALDPLANKVLWRTPSLTSNNEFVVSGKYIVTAYGFTSEPASIHVVRRTDGKILQKKPLAHTNFEMRLSGESLGVEMYHSFGRANFRLEGFAGDTPKLVTLPTTPPDPNEKPRPYDPPLLSTGPRGFL